MANAWRYVIILLNVCLVFRRGSLKRFPVSAPYTALGPWQSLIHYKGCLRSPRFPSAMVIDTQAMWCVHGYVSCYNPSWLCIMLQSLCMVMYHATILSRELTPFGLPPIHASSPHLDCPPFTNDALVKQFCYTDFGLIGCATARSKRGQFLNCVPSLRGA